MQEDDEVDRGFAVSSGSRQRKEAELGAYERAKQRWNEMRELKAEDLLNPTKTMFLPYPGWEDATGRPTIDDLIVGVSSVQNIIKEYGYLSTKQAMILVGGKGIGKTVRLRIFACIMYVKMHGTPERLISLWDMDTVRDPKALLHSLLMALRFTYCEDAAQVQVIQGLTSLEDVYQFFFSRRLAGERFTLILDGAQALDVQICYGSKRSNADNLNHVMMELSKFLFQARTIWGISPAAEKAVAYELHPSPDISRYKVKAGFNVEACDTYLKHTVLGRVLECSPQRKADLQYYAGCYPMFLKFFDAACHRVAEKKDKNETVTEDTIVELLQDQEGWDAVVQEFLTHPEIKSISYSIEQILQKITEPCQFPKDIAAKDPRYALDVATGQFCSMYVQHLYIHAFREKEAALDRSQVAGPWVAYCKLAVADVNINWGETGWLCERLCTSVTSRVGINLGDGLNIGEMKVISFLVIPNILKDLPSPGFGILYSPSKYNFGQVDSVIIYRDASGKLHLIGVQYTTSVETHMHSEDQFMSVSTVNEWIPNVRELVENNAWELHYSFVCLAESQPLVSKNMNIHKLKGGVYYGTLAHRLHIRSFNDALGSNRVRQDVLNLLVDMAKKRDGELANMKVEPFPPLPDVSAHDGPLKLSQMNLMKLKRAELDAIALNSGKLDPKRFRSIKSLVQELVSKNVILIVSAQDGPLKLSYMELKKRKRAELDAIALESGKVDPKRFRNINSLVQELVSKNVILIV